MKFQSKGYRAFSVVNIIIITVTMLLCLLPIINILAISLSSGDAAAAGFVGLWPVDFTLDAYSQILIKPDFFQAMWISVQRVVLALAISLTFCILVAYPLSKEKTTFHARPFYVGFFLFAMLFSGGLIPTYLVVYQLGLINSLWGLVLPMAAPFSFMILLMNFFRNIPGEIEESALIDGAGYFRILWKIYIPLSKSALASIALFIIILNWNEWMNGILYMNEPARYPLQSYLQTIIKEVNLETLTTSELLNFDKVTTRTSKAAQVFLALVPVLIVYPFLQKYFTTGLVLGSVKG